MTAREHPSYWATMHLNTTSKSQSEALQKIKSNPNGTTPVKVEIYKVSGKNAGKIVRTLKSKRLMHYGEYL
jgi:hypothetical protein